MRWITVAAVIWVNMMGVSFVVADDVDDVEAAYLQHIANSNSGNVDGFVGQHLPGHSAFGPTGALLTRYDSTEGEKKAGESGIRCRSRRQSRQIQCTSFLRCSSPTPGGKSLWQVERGGHRLSHGPGDGIRWHQPPKNSEGFIDVDQARWPVERSSRPPVRFAGE